MSKTSPRLAEAPLEFADPFDDADESPSERLARILAENDLNLLWHLRAIRTDLDITQTELAQRMGVTQPAIAAFESQGNDPKLSTIRRYAHALGVVVDHAVAVNAGDNAARSRLDRWGSSQVIHLAARQPAPAVARTGWVDQ